MKDWALGLLALAGACSALIAPALSQDVADSERQRIERVIREYLNAHPDVIVEALRAYEMKRQGEVVQASREALERDSTSPSAGNPGADVTVVEFFDYRCGYCKRVVSTVQELLKSDGNVRVVFKEFPILGADSQLAAQAAQAMWKLAPDKYFAYHIALMETRGTLDEARVLETAKKVGVDPAKLKAAMADPAVKEKIRANVELAEKLQITGTPAFVVGSKLVPGAIDLEKLRMLVAEARMR